MSGVVVIGSANADLVVKVPRRPGGGETLIGGELKTIPGGKGANQAAAAGSAGAHTSFIGCVGSDGHATLLRSSLSTAGVHTDAMMTTDSPTGTAIIFITPDGENSIVVSPGANHALTPDVADTQAELWRAASVAVLSLEIPFVTVAHVAQDAAAHGTRVIVNAAPAAGLDAEVIRVCDPLIVNEHEALEVLGADDSDPDVKNFEALAARLLRAGARSVVITLGAAGAVVADAGGTESLAAHHVTPVDTTGAGDAFVGALAAELSRGESLSTAVAFAQAMAALSVERFGAQTSYVSEAEVRAFMRATA